MDRATLQGPLVDILGAYLKQDRWTILGVTAMTMLAAAVSIAAPLLFSRLIDALPQGEVPQRLFLAFLAYAALTGFSSALGQIAQFLSTMSAENLSFIANTRFFETMLRKTNAFFVRHNPAEIQDAGADGGNALLTIVELVLIVLLPGLLQISLTFVTLGALINLEILAIVVIHGMVSIALTLVSIRRVRFHLEAAIAAGQEQARFVGNAVAAMETLRAFGSHDWMSRRFADSAQTVRDSWRSFILHRIPFVVLLGLGLAIQLGVTYALLLPRYAAGTLSLGDLVLFNMLVLQLNMPFEMIASAIDSVARARAKLAPMARMWAEPEESIGPGLPPPVPLSGSLSFEGVSHLYDNGRGLHPLSFTAVRGAITFLVGETGSGKSTVFRLVLKSLDPSAGRILFDGTDLATIDRAAWYRLIAVVPQEVVLLNESLADNILLGRPRDEARLRQAAEKAAILPFILALPEGFKTNVGERGLKLSGGERQRIAIARALYSDPAILFLDEASAALDDATEADIMQHIRALAASITIIAITHRRSVITPEDRVVTLRAAEATVEGTVAHETVPSAESILNNPTS